MLRRKWEFCWRKSWSRFYLRTIGLLPLLHPQHRFQHQCFDFFWFCEIWVKEKRYSFCKLHISENFTDVLALVILNELLKNHLPNLLGQNSIVVQEPGCTEFRKHRCLHFPRHETIFVTDQRVYDKKLWCFFQRPDKDVMNKYIENKRSKVIKIVAPLLNVKQKPPSYQSWTVQPRVYPCLMML